MQRLSSRTTFYQKRIFPFVFLGFLAVFIGIGVSASLANGKHAPIPFLLVPVGIAILFLVIMKKFVFDLVDEVWDAGDALIVRNRKQEERIPLSDIINLSYSPMMSPPRVTLWLRTPGLFGEKVSFCAPLSFIPFASSPRIDDLIRRIDVARQSAR